MSKRAFPWIVLALATAATPAAALDCARARSTVEKTICAKPDLLALDARLGRLYGRALEESQDSETVRVMQRDWLTRRDQCRDATCIEAAYQDRAHLLGEYLDALNLDDRRRVDFIPVGDGPKACLRFVPLNAPNVTPDCRVLEWRPLGEIGGRRRIHALYAIAYRWNGQDIAFAAPVLFTHDPDDPGLLQLDFMITNAAGLASPGAHDVSAPKRVRGAGGERLVFSLPGLPGRQDTRTYRLDDTGVWRAAR
ncbi:MAG: lysozyme inhibitor LprI family protein [Pseudomonadota bacterium]